MPFIFVELMSMVLPQKQKQYKRRRHQKKFAIITIKYMKGYMTGLIVILINSVEQQLRNRLKWHKISLRIYMKMDILMKKL